MEGESRRERGNDYSADCRSRGNGRRDEARYKGAQSLGCLVDRRMPFDREGCLLFRGHLREQGGGSSKTWTGDRCWIISEGRRHKRGTRFEPTTMQTLREFPVEALVLGLISSSWTSKYCRRST